MPAPLDQLGLDQVKGVGPKLAELLKKLDLSTVEDALYHLPSRYEDRRQLKQISRLQSGRQEVFLAKVLVAGEKQTSRSRKRIYEVIVGDDTGRISLKWFHFRKAWLQKKLPVGQNAVFIGEIRQFGSTREIHHPDVELIQEGADIGAFLQKDPLKFGRILPVYHLTEGLSQYRARKIWFELTRRFADSAVSTIPAAILEANNCLKLSKAFQLCHWPEKNTSIHTLETGRDTARRSIVFDEFFFLELGLALKKRGVELAQGYAFHLEHRYTKPLSQLLPYRLTDAQRRVLGEIKADMMAPVPMHRLVQGDVGSGKTIVALMAALIAIENDTQVALVAPTEILAEQHYKTFSHWLEQLDLRCGLLSSGMPSAEKKLVLEQLATGEIQLLVGTHAVLQEGVEFKKLGLGIVDEQHRFGVRQRGVLKQKGIHPDILVMTATPIPRTLSMTLYGDLSVSLIDQLPPGRKPVITTHYHAKQRSRAYEQLQQEVQAGRQAYIVYPLVEESEKSDLLAAVEGVEALQHQHPDIRFGLIHGRMKQQEKDQIMSSFRAGDIDVLVATTVIEVGVDIPNATMMIVEHADRFGLAQLHQLRGRVGRGAASSYCGLISSQHYSEEAKRRLDVMVATNDGFRIAEADLEIRGPGDFLGTRQAGLPDFRAASLLRDIQVLEQARKAAFDYVEEHGDLQSEECSGVYSEMLRRWGGRLDLATIG